MFTRHITRHRVTRSIRRLPLAPLVILALLVAAVAACRTPVGVDRIGRERAYKLLNSNALTNGEPSSASRQLLERHALFARFEDDPDGALRELHRIACAEHDRDYVFALAELQFLVARDAHDRRHDLAAAIYAWTFLYDPEFAGAFDPYDPRFRLACDLYNAALTEFLRDERGNEALLPGSFDLPFGHVEVAVAPTSPEWRLEGDVTYVAAADFELRGLRVRNWRRGIGVALIAAKPPPRRLVAMGPRAPIAVATANVVLRVNERRQSGERWDVTAALELRDPTQVPEIDVGGQRVPLERDISATIAYALQRSRVWDLEVSAFFSGSLEDYEPGLVFTSPYVPGRIPIVLVHGTASSPARWAELLNGLAAYPQLAKNFQVWLFTYNTGNIVHYSTWLLRKALADAVQRLDPDGKDPALRDMVMLGHSQGGLLAKLLVVDSGEIFWDQFARFGLDASKMPAEKREQLREIAVFDHSPFVRRVIFLATPLGGSYQAGRWYTRSIASLITLPVKMVDVGSDLLTANLRDPDELADLIPTSVGQMNPGSDFVRLLAGLPIAPDVKAHSIIAVDGDGPFEEGDDGVVEYRSAHFEGAASELVVRCGHSCQSDPLAIVEVRRILLEHLAAFDAAHPDRKADGG